MILAGLKRAERLFAAVRPDIGTIFAKGKVSIREFVSQQRLYSSAFAYEHKDGDHFPRRSEFVLKIIVLAWVKQSGVPWWGWQLLLHAFGGNFLVNDAQGDIFVVRQRAFECGVNELLAKRHLGLLGYLMAGSASTEFQGGKVLMLLLSTRSWTRSLVYESAMTQPGASSTGPFICDQAVSGTAVLEAKW